MRTDCSNRSRFRGDFDPFRHIVRQNISLVVRTRLSLGLGETLSDGKLIIKYRPAFFP